jgi:hypothetical protein
VIFCGRIPHDSAAIASAQIINPLGIGTALSYSGSGLWMMSQKQAYAPERPEDVFILARAKLRRWREPGCRG